MAGGTESVAAIQPRRGAWAAALRKALDKASSRYEGMRLLDEVAAKTVELALAGDTTAIREIADRLDGKATQAVEVGGPDGGPLEVKGTIRFVKASGDAPDA